MGHLPMIDCWTCPIVKKYFLREILGWGAQSSLPSNIPFYGYPRQVTRKWKFLIDFILLTMFISVHLGLVGQISMESKCL